MLQCEAAGQEVLWDMLWGMGDWIELAASPQLAQNRLYSWGLCPMSRWLEMGKHSGNQIILGIHPRGTWVGRWSHSYSQPRRQLCSRTPRQWAAGESGHLVTWLIKDNPGFSEPIYGPQRGEEWLFPCATKKKKIHALCGPTQGEWGGGHLWLLQVHQTAERKSRSLQIYSS